MILLPPLPLSRCRPQVILSMPHICTPNNSLTINNNNSSIINNISLLMGNTLVNSLDSSSITLLNNNILEALEDTPSVDILAKCPPAPPLMATLPPHRAYLEDIRGRGSFRRRTSSKAILPKARVFIPKGRPAPCPWEEARRRLRDMEGQEGAISKWPCLMAVSALGG